MCISQFYISLIVYKLQVELNSDSMIYCNLTRVHVLRYSLDESWFWLAR